jgi:outer membrane protein assembly factor BamB
MTVSRLVGVSVVAVAALLAACSSTIQRPKPADITAVKVQQDVRQVWTARMGEVNFPLVPYAFEGQVAVADSRGAVAVIQAQTGKDVWRVSLDEPIIAGVGGDGQNLAVVTRSNQLVVLRQGKVTWRQNLVAESFTAPLIAGGRVFVLGADRKVQAFDAQSGRRLWTQQRTGEPLVLRQNGLIMPFKNTLLVGFSGRLAGLNPDTGVARWELPIATPRGTNDMERLVDLLGPAYRTGDVVCVRAFQAQLGCVDAERGQTLWTRASIGERTVLGQGNTLFSVLSNGVVQGIDLKTGERVWESERLKYRQLSPAAVTPRGLLVGDSGGWLYLLSLADGELLNRVRVEGNELAAAPAVASDSQVVTITRDGRVAGWQIP